MMVSVSPSWKQNFLGNQVTVLHQEYLVFIPCFFMTTTMDAIFRCKKMKFVEIQMLSYLKGLAAYNRKRTFFLEAANIAY